MRNLMLAVTLLCSASVYAHTPVCRCELKGDRIDCKGGFHDGSGAADVTMRVVAYTGESLVIGKLDDTSRFSTALPSQPFYILMDVGPGEVFEVDWTDIEGMERQHFQSAGQDESNDEPCGRTFIFPGAQDDNRTMVSGGKVAGSGE